MMMVVVVVVVKVVVNTHISVSAIDISTRYLQDCYNIAMFVRRGHQKCSSTRIICTIGILTYIFIKNNSCDWK
jgi:hypothetical protein